MKKIKQIQDLQAITQLVFTAQSQEVQKLNQEQQKLREKLADLAQEEERSQRMIAEDMQLRMTRMDVLWQAWIGEQKSALNLRLAQVSAEKERSLSKLKTAFGRKEVATGLVDQARALKRPAGRDR
ncbi:hypothetical protein ACSSNL_05570 [Thalassobius sp. S69A]|uniref:hypothetical protein n=1 Tax=unclassified Thalassovita TaxID=2619711 RepID=UPI000C103F3A|nr:hypothetical protein [Paracoccaceae bacterium]MBT26128.1 hypothetical protein [Paracoccaceae bacterium]|tara:strand:+ start:130 stop:507 length:378 start_codon:yes stop_codon:yes gene_type:complete